MPANEYNQNDFESITTDVLNNAVYNVQGYGANGDGTGDDKGAINSAATAADNAGGGTVFFPPGTYRITGTHSDGALIDTTGLTNPVDFMGAGWSSEIKLADGTTDSSEGAILWQPGDDQTIHHLAINGNQQNNGGTGDGETISDATDGGNIVKAGDNVTVHHVKSYNSTGDGFESRADEATAHDNLFVDNWEQDIHFWGPGSDAHDNLCKACKNDGAIRIYADGNTLASGDPDNISITDNIILDPETNGIELNSPNKIPEQVTIEGNIIINSSDIGIQVRTGHNVIISDNLIENPTSHGMLFEEPSAGNTQRIRCHGNTVREAGAHGIVVAELDDVVIRNNEVRKAQQNGIQLGGSGAKNRNIIADNELIDNNQGNGGDKAIEIFTGSSAMTNLRVVNNYIDSTGTPKHRNGVFVNSSGGSFSECVATGNEVYNVQFASFVDVQSSFNTVERNVGHVTENSGSASVSDTDTIAHGLTTTPTYVDLTASADGHIAVATAVDGTNITVGLHDDAGSAVTGDETVYWRALVR